MKIKNPTNGQIALQLCKANPTSRYASLLEYDAKKGKINEDNLQLFVGEPEVANEFIADMANKIVVQHAYDLMRGFDKRVGTFEKPMSKLGDVEELLTATLATPKDYDGTTDDNSPFKADKPAIKLAWIKTEDRKEVDVRLSYDIWAGAFTTEGTLSNIAGIILKNLKDAIDKYILTAVNSDLCDPLKVTKTATIQSVADAGEVVNAQKAYEQIVKLAYDMSLPTTLYNNANVETLTPIGSGILILNSRYRSSFDVNVLASLFHEDKIAEGKFFKEVIMLPLEEGTVGVVLDEEAYMWGYRLNTSASIQNPKTLEINTFYHAWIKRAVVPFRQAVRLTIA